MKVTLPSLKIILMIIFERLQREKSPFFIFSFVFCFSLFCTFLEIGIWFMKFWTLSCTRHKPTNAYLIQDRGWFGGRMIIFLFCKHGYEKMSGKWVYIVHSMNTSFFVHEFKEKTCVDMRYVANVFDLGLLGSP